MKWSIGFIIFSVFLTTNPMTGLARWKSVGKYKKIHHKGHANCIFSNTIIHHKKEHLSTIKTTFTKPEKVYTRCYYPGPIGKTYPKRRYYEIWIGNRMVSRVKYTTVSNPTWNQTRLPVTEAKYFKKHFARLKKGKHKITFWIIKDIPKGHVYVTRRDQHGNVTTEREKKWAAKFLSSGSFTYIVP